MVSFARCVLALASLITVTPSSEAQSVPAAHDAQAWVQFVGVLPVGSQWLVHTEVQPRGNADLSRRDQVILRGGVGRRDPARGPGIDRVDRMGPGRERKVHGPRGCRLRHAEGRARGHPHLRVGTRATVWAGYGYMPKWQAAGDLAHEQRSWQQLSLTLPAVGKWRPSLRVRPEQRFVDAWADRSHRVRAMARIVRPVGVTRWSLAWSNEYFVTLDGTVDGPARGFDQNRVFGGMNYRFSRASTVEGGYLWQLLPSTASAARRHNHTMFVWFNSAPPAR